MACKPLPRLLLLWLAEWQREYRTFGPRADARERPLPAPPPSASAAAVSPRVQQSLPRHNVLDEPPELERGWEDTVATAWADEFLTPDDEIDVAPAMARQPGDRAHAVGSDSGLMHARLMQALEFCESSPPPPPRPAGLSD